MLTNLYPAGQQCSPSEQHTASCIKQHLSFAHVVVPFGQALILCRTRAPSVETTYALLSFYSLYRYNQYQMEHNCVVQDSIIRLGNRRCMGNDNMLLDIPFHSEHKRYCHHLQKNNKLTFISENS